MGCQRCIFFSAPTEIMVPWYTVEPPTNGLCPKHCTCAVLIVDNDVQDCLEGYHDRQAWAISEQTERTDATKESLIAFASTTYWEGKADLLKIPPHLMDITAPLPSCVRHLVERRVDGMLEDFNDLEEWFFAFNKAPAHEKESIIAGYADGSYSGTLKKRREVRATLLAVTESYSVAADPLPIFGPSSKNLKQTTLTQDFTDVPSVQQVHAKDSPLIDLTNHPPQPHKDGKRKAVIDLTRRRNRSPILTVGEAVLTHNTVTSASDLKPPTAVAFRFTTPPHHKKGS
jgi:hypothetical protein